MDTLAANHLPFAAVKKGSRARVVGVLTDSQEIRRLQDMGLTEGVVFEVVKIAPLGDPIEIALRGYRLCLRRKETEGIMIEILG